MRPVSIKAWITIKCSSSSVGPEDSLIRLSTVRSHPFHNELSQLSVDLFLAPFTALSSWAIVRIRHVAGSVFSPGSSLLPVRRKIAKSSQSLAPGTFFDRFFAIPLPDRDVSLACYNGDMLILSLRSFWNAGQSAQGLPGNRVCLSSPAVKTGVDMGSNLLKTSQNRFSL
jgi:hypothetical protein